MSLHLVILSSPSGAGKSTLAAMLLDDPDLPGYQFSISHTTRAPRGHEIDGREYRFVSEAEFEEMIGRNRFVEHARVHGHQYGTSIEEISRISDMPGARGIVFDIDWQGARQIMSRFPAALSIFVLPPSLEVLEDRLRRRGTDTRQVIKKRMRNAVQEIEKHSIFHQCIINDNRQRAYGILKTAVEHHLSHKKDDPWPFREPKKPVELEEEDAKGRWLASLMLKEWNWPG